PTRSSGSPRPRARRCSNGCGPSSTTRATCTATTGRWATSSCGTTSRSSTRAATCGPAPAGRYAECRSARSPSACARCDLVRAVVGAVDDVAHPLHVRLGKHGADEVDLARARLPVALRHREDGAVVLDDTEALPVRLACREVAVLVEDARELLDLRPQRALLREACGRVADALVAPALEQRVDQ